MGAAPRLAALGGVAAGLTLSGLVPPAERGTTLVALLAVGLALIPGRRSGPITVRLVLVALAAALVGLQAGAARLRSIDAGALDSRPGERISVQGEVIAVPRRDDAEVRVPLDTAQGRVLAAAPEPVADLPIGATVRSSGVLARPPRWLEPALRRQGITRILRTSGIEPTGKRRGGLLGRLDLIRDRAEEALGAGMSPREAALARGFVLGQDDRIDAATVNDFRRSGLSHLLAVSGQNVMLLILLASPVLAGLGIPLRARLLWLLMLIGLYVPLAGAGPSIARAGVMGAAGVLAMLAGRPASRAFALLLAASATLLINPRVSGDPGWQLSFAAVVGIFLLAAPVRDAFLARLGSGSLQRGLAEGAALTIAATLATAPLVSHHFGALPAGSLVANLLALPAVGPSMWLGMIAAALGQLPGAPVEPLNWLNALLLAYVAQIAAWCGRPAWAVLSLRLEGAGELLIAYAALGSIAVTALRIEAARRLARRRRPLLAAPRRRLRITVAVAAALVSVVLVRPSVLPWDRAAPAAPGSGLQIEILDVGQGDAILIQPAGGEAILVDGGPPGDGLAEKLRAAGVERLGAAVVTHDQSDHAGGIAEILGEFPVRRLVFAHIRPRLLGAARSAGTIPYRVAEGSEIVSGRLRLQVLWPPRDPVEAVTGDPNEFSIVLVARWRTFAMLLTGDAEAEDVPMDPGPIDVLKVAHHGSEDAGLAALLGRTSPGLAVISVGGDNPFGHPTAETLATLADRGVPVLRTDRDGTIFLRVDGRGFQADLDG